MGSFSPGAVATIALWKSAPMKILIPLSYQVFLNMTVKLSEISDTLLRVTARRRGRERV